MSNFAQALRGIAIAEFALRGKVKVLDFGYQPSALARIAAGRAMGKSGANPRLEQFIIDYATCWPLIAASSVKVLYDHEPFICECIVPQMTLQWATSNAECDGIRFFSTQFTPGPDTEQLSTKIGTESLIGAALKKSNTWIPRFPWLSKQALP